MPQTWDVILRLGQGFAAGVVVGTLWALWIIRRRRTASAPGEQGARSWPAGHDAAAPTG